MNSGVRPAQWAASILLHLAIGLALWIGWPRTHEIPPLIVHVWVPNENSAVTSGSKNPSAPRAPLPEKLTQPTAPKPTWQPLTNPTFNRKVPQPKPDDLASADALFGQSPAQPAAQRSSRWASSGSEAPPEVPPPPPAEWTPSGQVTWHIQLLIPASGGQPQKIDGLSSAHPELDAWLSNWLSRQVFPASDNHNSYMIQWTLDLKAVVPQ